MTRTEGRVLVDTDILIDAARGVTVAVDSLSHLEAQGSLATSVITELEMLVGCRNRREQNVVERFLRRFEVIPLDLPISMLSVSLMKRYRLSHGLLIADALIAATALAAPGSLLTKNMRDYRFIEGLVLAPYPETEARSAEPS